MVDTKRTATTRLTPELSQGSLSVPVDPPSLPDVGSGAIAVISQQAGADSGVLVSYSGVFTSQFWTTGPPVPFLIEILQPEQVRQIRNQVVEQLRGPGSGLDDLPLRAFAEAARLYLEPEASSRFTLATFGAITQPAAGDLQGEVSWSGGVAGTVLGSGGRVLAQSHLAPVPAGKPAPLREADLRSLVRALQCAVDTQDIDPLWKQMLSLAGQVLP
jgi:hypothetical protein